MAGDHGQPMSIDAMIDMERQEVLALLENKNRGAASPERLRSTSPLVPPSHFPVRSMLDVDQPGSSDERVVPSTQAPVRSMLDVGGRPASMQPRVRNLLDPVSPSSALAKNRSSSPTSPGFPSSMSQGSLFPRSVSGPGLRPEDFGLRSSGRHDRTSQYRFSSFLPHRSGASLRGSQSSRRLPTSPMSPPGDSLRGPDLSGLQLPPSDQGRQSSRGSRLGNPSMSPHNQWDARSRSPVSSLSLNRAILDSGKTLDINNAYRRLSDANLACSSGSLAQLPMRTLSDEAQIGEGRLVKDYIGPDGEHLDSSDDDDQASSDKEDRGRKMEPRSLNPDSPGDATKEGSPRSPSGQERRQSRSLLAAAEQERKFDHQIWSLFGRAQMEAAADVATGSQIAAQRPLYQYRSLLDEPEVRVTKPSGDVAGASKASKKRIRPNTSYDPGLASTGASVVDSDEEAEVDDIKRAQQLAFSMTNILSKPDSHRAIRIIYRGEWKEVAQQAAEEKRRFRTYLVATDLSDESTHALEWAIGTVLRDGDTMIAIYCVDEDTGILASEGASVPDEAKEMKEQAAALNTMTKSKTVPVPMNIVPEIKRAQALHMQAESRSGIPGSSPAPPARDRNRAEEERQRAILQTCDRVVRLLRKTRLQVRVIVEVLHCKNPKHLMTEVIDLVNPTLVVIGSRGRSALKGVILGSFSNYLVTKSSVPVMVARKRLRKQNKCKRQPVRQVNHLSNPNARSLANAKID